MRAAGCRPREASAENPVDELFYQRVTFRYERHDDRPRTVAGAGESGSRAIAMRASLSAVRAMGNTDP